MWVVLSKLHWRPRTYVCECYRKATSSYDSYGRYEQCIDYIPYYLSVMSRAHFCDNLFRNSCTEIECFHSRGQHLYKFIGTKKSVCIRKELNSQRIGLGHQHDRRSIVLRHQYGRRDVM